MPVWAAWEVAWVAGEGGRPFLLCGHSFSREKGRRGQSQGGRFHAQAQRPRPLSRVRPACPLPPASPSLFLSPFLLHTWSASVPASGKAFLWVGKGGGVMAGMVEWLPHTMGRSGRSLQGRNARNSMVCMCSGRKMWDM